MPPVSRFRPASLRHGVRLGKPVGSAGGPYTQTAAYTKQATKIAASAVRLRGRGWANLLKSAPQCSAETGADQERSPGASSFTPGSLKCRD
jgi:hypothetical protein